MFIYLLIPINLAVQYFFGGTQSDVLNLFILVAVLPSILVLSNQSEDATLKFGKYSQALLFFVYALGCAGAIINIDIKILLICLILTELRDLISYWMGKFFGKIIVRNPKGIIPRILNCKIAEKVSPNKTWAVGGLSTVSLCLLVMTLPPTFFTFGSKTMSSGFLISWMAAIGASGLFGDLIFSLMKREYGVKDSGQMLPGKSGVIDRIDSLAVTFPVTYFLLLNFPPS
jgi:phosphatidate cytidylyltransferase